MEINTAGTGLAYSRRLRNLTYNGKRQRQQPQQLQRQRQQYNGSMQQSTAAWNAVVKCKGKGKRLHRFLAIKEQQAQKHSTPDDDDDDAYSVHTLMSATVTI